MRFKVLLPAAALCFFSVTASAEISTPRDKFLDAATKSSNTTGLNFESKIRLTDLTSASETKKQQKKRRHTSTEIASLTIKGATDNVLNRAEMRYDFKFSKDDMKLSIGFPLVIDGESQTIYIGTELVNFLLRKFYPHLPEASGDLVRINLNELVSQSFQSNAPDTLQISRDLKGVHKIEILRRSLNPSFMAALATVSPSCFSYQSVTKADKKAGIRQNFRLVLSNDELFLVTKYFAENLMQRLRTEDAITEQEYAAFQEKSVQITNAPVMSGATIKVTLDFGVTSAGLIMRTVGRVQVAFDTTTALFETVTTLTRYNQPKFAISVDKAKIVDITEITEQIRGYQVPTTSTVPVQIR